jgi:hypothetical protein
VVGSVVVVVVEEGGSCVDGSGSAVTISASLEGGTGNGGSDCGLWLGLAVFLRFNSFLSFGGFPARSLLFFGEDEAISSVGMEEGSGDGAGEVDKDEGGTGEEEEGTV